jgi:hypothetical protein
VDWSLAYQLTTLARVARLQGDLEAAQTYGKESLKVARGMGSKPAIPRALRDLGLVTIQQSDLATGGCLMRESLVLWQELQSGWGMAEALEGCAHLGTAHEKPERAARLFGAAEALRERIGIGVQAFERPEYDQGVAATRAALGEEVFAAAWEEGRALTLDQAATYALEGCDTSSAEGE